MQMSVAPAASRISRPRASPWSIIFRLFALIARPFVRRRLAKFVLRPIKAMAEAEAANGSGTASAARVPAGKN